jgi:hypothetical protein
MPNHTYPHGPYIAAVCAALTNIGYDPTDCFTDDSDTAGSYRYLRAVITVGSGASDLPAANWPHGLVLIWEWHTGAEADLGELTRGPFWEWARLIDSHGKCGERQALTAWGYGYASPRYVAESVQTLARCRDQAALPERWEHANELASACDEWAVKEISSRSSSRK